MSSGAWASGSIGGVSVDGTAMFGKLVTIPAFGLDGRSLLFTMGGRSTGDNGVYRPFSNITFYDPYIGV